MTIMTLLVVEDDDLDYLAVQRELLQQDWEPQVVRAGNGEEAKEQLDLAMPYGPCLVVLDLSLPKVSGLEFLQTIRANEAYDAVPVFVLTTSDTSRDLQRAYELGVTGYFLKDDVGESFSKVIQMIRLYSEVAHFPSSQAS